LTDAHAAVVIRVQRACWEKIRLWHSHCLRP
jgi:hypothetical protein